MTFDNQIEWTKVEVSECTGRTRLRGLVTVDPKHNTVQIANDIWAKAGWSRPAQRVDLYSQGRTFMFKPAKVGCITFKENSSAKNGAMLVTSMPLRLALMAPVVLDIDRDAKRIDYTAWAEGDCVMFRYGGEEL